MNYYQTPQMNRSCQVPRRPESCSANCQASRKPEPCSANYQASRKPESCSANCQDSRKPEHSSKKALAMAYVPWQKFEDLYPNDAALSKGTLFCQLDLPFRGKR